MPINTQLSFIQIFTLSNLSNILPFALKPRKETITLKPRKPSYLHQWLPILSSPSSLRNTTSAKTLLIGTLSRPSDSRMSQVLPTKPSAHFSKKMFHKSSSKCWRLTTWNPFSKGMIGRNGNRPNTRLLGLLEWNHTSATSEDLSAFLTPLNSQPSR